MGQSGGAGSSMRKEEEKRQAMIRLGMGNIDETFGKYTAPFYQKRADAYVNYAMPSVGDEYRQTVGTVGTALADRGLRKSGVATRFYSALARESAKQERGVVDQAQAEANKLRGQVEDTRSNLVSQLYQTADPANAKTGALAAATQFTAPSTFAPVGNFFNDWSKTWLAGRLNNAYGSTNTGNSGSNMYAAPKAAASSWSVMK